MNQRSSGVLLHISSLPSEFGIGDFGPSAYRFVDWLCECGQRYWQILPLTTVDPICGNSPYSSASAFAGNFLFISPDLLIKEGLITTQDLGLKPEVLTSQVNYPAVYTFKKEILQKACQNFSDHLNDKFEQFQNDHREWLDDYALFITIKKNLGGKIWSAWPEQLKHRQALALNKFRKEFFKDIDEIKRVQFLFFKQWFALKSYSRNKGIRIIGDMPIYVNFDSSDVWSNIKNFKIDNDGSLNVVAGVPPDYFSQTGQKWGNPVYDWQELQKSNYQWWVDRFKFAFNLFDVLRVDHFRGFINYWEIPAKDKTAKNGCWVDVPTKDFFMVLKERLGSLPIIAEDLGLISEEVRQQIDMLGFPGMKILLFAFGDNLKDNFYLPHNYSSDCVVYTGTHDNNTVKGWFQEDATKHEKQNIFSYLRQDIDINTVSWALIHLAFESEARICMIPLQDILNLGGDSRMNRPGSGEGNWEWQLNFEELDEFSQKKLTKITKKTGRV